MTNTTKLINRGEQSARLSYYLSEAKTPLRFALFYALVYGFLRLLEYGSFKLFVGGSLPQALSYLSFLVAVTTGIMSQLLLDFAIFIIIGAAVVAVIYALRLGVKWLLNRSDAAVDSLPKLPESVIIYGSGPAVTFGERIERKATTKPKRKTKKSTTTKV